MPQEEQAWLIQDMSKELKAWGHPRGPESHLILKSDNEGAVTTLRDHLARYHGGRISTGSPARGESSSNGTVEQAGQICREFARVFKDQLEEKAKIHLEPSDTIAQWLIRWAAMNVSRYHEGGDDHKTPYQRRRGRPCRLAVVPFGEKGPLQTPEGPNITTWKV